MQFLISVLGLNFRIEIIAGCCLWDTFLCTVSNATLSLLSEPYLINLPREPIDHGPYDIIVSG